jgi:uncharacterized protein (TIGR02145 family)
MKTILYAALLLLTIGANAQIAIGTAVPDPSAALDVSSTKKGLLLPRMTSAQRTAIASPATGLLVYDTTTSSLWYHNGTAWIDTAIGGIYKGSGSLTTNTTVAAGNNTLAFTTTASNGFSVDGTTLSVDAANHAVGIGTTAPANSSILDLTSTNKGLLLPRVANTAAITTPANGILIYDLSSNCLKVYQNGSWSDCLSFVPTPVSAVCTGFSGSYCTNGLSSATYAVTLTNNDFSSKQVTPQTIDLSLSGITGLNVSAVSPNTVTTINAGASLVVTYTISGVPGSTGTLTGSFSKQGMSCSSTVTVGDRAVSAASDNPTTTNYLVMANVTHTTTNAAGIGAATGLPPGVSAAWASDIITIGGTPTKEGTFSYSIPINGCGASVNATGTITVNPVVCRALVAPGVYKNFMCYNLGATDTSGDPNTPVQGIHGNYYQWGSVAVVATASTSAAAISGWNGWNNTAAAAAADGSWSDNSKTANDPCPAGYRVPTKAQWDAVLVNNSISRTGSWTNNGNFTSAVNFGSDLSLPAAGFRGDEDGTLYYRGSIGDYCSSSEIGDGCYYLSLVRNNARIYGGNRFYGHSVRCISE